MTFLIADELTRRTIPKMESSSERTRVSCQDFASDRIHKEYKDTSHRWLVGVSITVWDTSVHEGSPCFVSSVVLHLRDIDTLCLPAIAYQVPQLGWFAVLYNARKKRIFSMDTRPPDPPIFYTILFLWSRLGGQL
jgi:hypothetical protein